MSKQEYVVVVSSSGVEVSIPAGLKEQFIKSGYELKKVKGSKDGK